MEDLKSIIKRKLEAAGFKEISFTQKGKLEGFEFLLSLYFPRTFRTIYFYRENKSAENIIVEFLEMPPEWKGFRIYKDELDEFIHHFIITSNSIDSVGEGPLASWSRKKTTTNMELSHKSAKKFKYYLGHSNFDFYGELHRSFIWSPFVTNYCFNEGAGEAGIWGSAQYRTWYSATVVNYEGYAVTKKVMLYYISGSYIPTVFNRSRIIGKITHDCVEVLPKDAPIDLVGAFDTINFLKFIPPATLLAEILKKANKNWKAPFEALHYLLTQTEFKKYSDPILKSPNINIRNAVAQKAIYWKDVELAKKVIKKA